MDNAKPERKKGLRSFMSSDEIKAELTPEEWQDLNLSLPQMTGGAMKFVASLAEERIQKRALVAEVESLKKQLKSDSDRCNDCGAELIYIGEQESGENYDCMACSLVAKNERLVEAINNAIQMQLRGASDGCGFVPDYLKDIFLTRDIKSIENTVLSSKSLIDNAIKRLEKALRTVEGGE